MPQPPLNQRRGSAAEDLAAAYLTGQGLHLLARNFRVRGGEIDLILRDGPTLVFVEVRLRSSTAYGGAAASISAVKQRRLILAARHYLQRHHRGGEPTCRFDAVLLGALDQAHLQWLKNAFTLA